MFRWSAVPGRGWVAERVHAIEGDNGVLLAHHVVLSPSGFVVVSADDRQPPVVCFSPTARLGEHADGTTLRAMLERDLQSSRNALDMSSSVGLAGTSTEPGRASVSANRNEWQELLGKEGDGPRLSALESPPSEVLVAPMLTTSWSQWNHYDDYCPESPNPLPGYDGRVPVGCVPVAGAQVAKYYEWPPYGWGWHVDVDDDPTDGVTGRFYAVFSDAIDWSNMQTNYDPWIEEPVDAVAAVAEVMYEFGVATDIDYGTNGSSAQIGSLLEALADCYFFERSEYRSRAGREQAFDSDVRQAMLEQEPVIASLPGHAVVIDGLAEELGNDYFHINAGWGGSSDGWYRLSNVDGESVSEGLFGARPLLMPVFGDPDSRTFVSNEFELTWCIADARKPDAVSLRLLEGLWQNTNITDAADDFGQWVNQGEWTIEQPGRSGGSCFRRLSGTGGSSPLVLYEALMVGGGVMTFAYQTSLADDHLCVDVSDDGGMTWNTLADVTDNWGSPWPWDTQQVDLGAYADREIMVRFNYLLTNGVYYVGGGVRIDDVSISGVECRDWTVAATGIDPLLSSWVVTGRTDNVYYYALQASDGGGWLRRSPAKEVVVFHPDCDADGDGLRNGWEHGYFGSVTGGVAGVDSDGDLMPNSAEQEAGTSPVDETSLLSVCLSDTGQAGLELAWSSVAGKKYSVWRGTDLSGGAGSFSCIASNVDAVAPTNTFTDLETDSSPCFFYCVRVE